MTRRSISSLAARSALGGVIAGTLVALLGGGIAAQGQAIAGHDSNAPVNYAADRIELQDKQKRVVLSGNVAISQANLNLHAARTTVAYTDEGSLKIQRIDATGGVTVERGNETVRGDVAIYDFNSRIITMVGNVSLLRGSDTLRGGRMVIDLSSGVASVDGRSGGSSSAGGRVSGSFSVPKKN